MVSLIYLPSNSDRLISYNNTWPFDLQDDFSSTDYSVHGPKAFFANMPLSKTLTMNIDVPEPWLVEPVIAMYATH